MDSVACLRVSCTNFTSVPLLFSALAHCHTLQKMKASSAPIPVANKKCACPFVTVCGNVIGSYGMELPAPHPQKPVS
jgi:hypothetical protein